MQNFPASVALLTLPQLLAAVAGVGLLIAGICVWAYARRRKHLIARYGDPEIARCIMRGTVWKGETQEQLLESLGQPADLDQKVLKTKTKEIWKYRKTARNRFGLKVTLDDGIVTGWEQND